MMKGAKFGGDLVFSGLPGKMTQVAFFSTTFFFRQLVGKGLV